MRAVRKRVIHLVSAVMHWTETGKGTGRASRASSHSRTERAVSSTRHSSRISKRICGRHTELE